MSRKYTLKEVESILRDVLLGILQHMEAIRNELKKLDLKEDGTDSAESLARAKQLTLVLVCLNDCLHPAFKTCKRYFKGADELFDSFERNHELAVKNKLVPECHCGECIRKSESSDINS
jgi:hypothetical protein